MAPGDEQPPSDAMRERVSESTREMWFILEADRWVVVSVFSLGLFVGLVGIGLAYPQPTGTLLRTGDAVETLAQALVTSTITGVTLVLTLSQLVLSQELGAVGDQRDRMEGAMEFRKDVANAIGSEIGPVEPAAFLRTMVEATKQQANDLSSAVDESKEVHDLVSTLVDTVTGNADAVSDQLKGATFGEFDVLSAALNYNYSWKLYAARRLRVEHEDRLNDEALEALDDLIQTLEFFGPAREHFKTLYFQWELSNLSRTLLYAALPALGVGIVMLLFVSPGMTTDRVFSISLMLPVVAGLTTIAVLPFTILLAYILRIVTITKRTLSIGPFILRETDRSADVDWSD